VLIAFRSVRLGCAGAKPNALYQGDRPISCVLLSQISTEKAIAWIDVRWCRNALGDSGVKGLLLSMILTCLDDEASDASFATTITCKLTDKIEARLFRLTSPPARDASRLFSSLKHNPTAEPAMDTLS
jgi:hypothetical protein